MFLVKTYGRVSFIYESAYHQEVPSVQNGIRSNGFEDFCSDFLVSILVSNCNEVNFCCVMITVCRFKRSLTVNEDSNSLLLVEYDVSFAVICRDKLPKSKNTGALIIVLGTWKTWLTIIGTPVRCTRDILLPDTKP